jgi:two-component system CheB/CheR fusion protein
MRILLVEDHRDSAQVMAKILRTRGFEVEIATDCKDGMRAFEERHFDLVILDIRLPDGDGCDLLTLLAQTRPVKSIAISAYPMYQNFNRVRAAGFDRYLPKPLAAQHVYGMIDELFPSPTFARTENSTPAFADI